MTENAFPPLLDPATDPFPAIAAWMNEAAEHELNDPTAVALATVDARGRPSVRMVLAKAVGPDGVVFFTNLQSRKGTDLHGNPNAALLWHWKSLRRQVRIEGRAQKVTPAEADRYFASRHPESRRGALASDQSRPMPDREAFERRVEELRARYGDDDIPRPGYWSGFRIIPEAVELWQDRPHRLHDRVRWEKTEAGWNGTRLFP
jgi:pyridoxamine 5'-phosphate oxidase